MKNFKFKKILDTFRDSNSTEIQTKTDKPPNFENSFDFSNSPLESIALQYYELVTLEELSELEAQHLDKILEQAETDEVLSLLLNEIDELTFKELGFYEKENLEQVKNLRAKVKEFIIKSEKNQKIDCSLSIQSISEYQNILNEYYKLTTLKELDESEAQHLDKILEQAETDERLGLLLNEVDELTFEELGFYEKENLEQVENQQEKTKQHIGGISCLIKSKDYLSSNEVKENEVKENKVKENKVKEILKNKEFFHNPLAKIKPQNFLQKAIDSSEQILLKWMKLYPSAFERMGRRIVEMESFIQQFAQSRIAEQRLVQLNSIATGHQSPANKIVLKIVIIVIGAFTFTSAMRLFAASLGPVATPAALLGGMLVSLAVDYVATKASNNYVRRQSTRKILNRLVKAKLKQENQLAYSFYESQEKLVYEIEGNCLSKEFPLNACLGGFLSTAEFVTAFWIVGQIGFLSGIPIPVRVIASSLPVVLTWVAAYIQAQSFELPDYCAELIPEYESRIYPSSDMSPDEIKKWYIDRYAYIARLDAGIHNILDETPHLEHPTPELAEIAFNVTHFQERAEYISQEQEQVLTELEDNFQQEIKNLGQEFPSEEIIKKGRNWQDIELQKRTIEEARKKWVEQEQLRREKAFEDKKYQFIKRYTNAQQSLIDQSTRSQEKYDRIYQKWLEKNRELKTLTPDKYSVLLAKKTKN